MKNQAEMFVLSRVRALMLLGLFLFGSTRLVAIPVQADAVTASLSQANTSADFSGPLPRAGAITEHSVRSCEGQGEKWGDGTGRDWIDPACMRAFYMKANPVAVRNADEDRVFAFGYRNMIFVRSPDLQLVPKGMQGEKDRRLSKKLADKIISGSSSRLADVRAIALDPRNREIASIDTSAGEVLLFGMDMGGNLAPLRSFKPNDTAGIASLAVDTQNDQLILVRPGTASLDFHSRWADVDGRVARSGTQVLKSIHGGKTGLVGPNDAVVDSGELIVLDSGGNQILIYPASASGDVEPVRAIRGAQTRLQDPRAISFSATANEIVVWNGDGSILRFARNASGNASPR